MLQPKKPLKQLIQNAFKKGTEKSEMKKKMPKLNSEREKFDKDLSEKTAKKFGKAASSYQPSRPANDNAPKYKASNATVSKVNFEREKWEKGLSGNVPMGSGSKSKPSSESSSRYKSQK